MKELLLIRHGETDYNRHGRFLGIRDIGLNNEGRNQALNLKNKLEGEEIDYVISSDLLRCRETAEIINFGQEIYHTKNLREMNFGRWEGLTWEEIRESYGPEFKDWRKDWINFKITEGESFYDMSRKVIAEIDTILESRYNRIAVVSHGGCIRTILGYYLLESIEKSWRFQIDNGTIARLCFSRDYTYLKTLNEK